MAPMLEVFENIDADNRRRRFKVYAAAFIAGLFVIAGAWIDGDVNRAPRNAPQACADRLGIRWNVTDGATERLAEFKKCVHG